VFEHEQGVMQNESENTKQTKTKAKTKDSLTNEEPDQVEATVHVLDVVFRANFTNQGEGVGSHKAGQILLKVLAIEGLVVDNVAIIKVAENDESGSSDLEVSSGIILASHNTEAVLVAERVGHLGVNVQGVTRVDESHHTDRVGGGKLVNGINRVEGVDSGGVLPVKRGII
jgi:hypothetical protein